MYAICIHLYLDVGQLWLHYVLFFTRENQLGANQAITIHDDELIITSREKKVHRFCYDHCFWSFDNNSAPHAGQDTVYKALAQPLLDKAFEGYNTCLFAYGQVLVYLFFH